MFPQLFHLGKFFLPTYGFLVSMGVLIGLWISVRNSERLGYDGDKAWNLGILVVLCGIVGAKVLYIINEWSYYSTHVSEIFSIEHPPSWRCFLRRPARCVSGRGLVRVETSHAASRNLRRFCPRPCLGARDRAHRMLRRRLLLRKRDASLVGRNVYQSIGERDHGYAL